MRKTWNGIRYSLILLLAVPLLACGPTQVELDATSTQIAAVLFATQTAGAPTTTPTQTATLTPTATVTPTPTLTETPTPDKFATDIAAVQASIDKTREALQFLPTIEAQQTQEAEDALFAMLAEDGAITESRRGELYEINDFDESWAQRGWYQWWPFDYYLSNFVLLTHIEWELPTTSAISYSGCGFVFRIKDENNHLVVFLDVRWNAELGYMKPAGYSQVTSSWSAPNSKGNAPLELTGSADFMVVAEGETVTAYINGERDRRWHAPITERGNIAYTLLSGTNKDFGIHCQMSDTRVYNLVK